MFSSSPCQPLDILDGPLGAPTRVAVTDSGVLKRSTMAGSRSCYGALQADDGLFLVGLHDDSLTRQAYDFQVLYDLLCNPRVCGALLANGISPHAPAQSLSHC